MYFSVYKSSAGSGKTFTLVKEYVKLVLEHPDKYRHILAITFTNKAANEMKQRILTSLKEIAKADKYANQPSVKIMMPEIAENTGMSNDVLTANAARVLTSILHNYSDFAVNTIDSFMHRVIRSFAFDLHIPMDFEVELEQDEILRKMVDVLISRAGTEEKLTRFLVEFTRSKAEDEKNWHIENDIFSIAQMLLKEDSSYYISQLKGLSLDDFSKIIRKLQQWIIKFEERIQTQGKIAWRAIQSRGLGHACFYRGVYGIGKYFENIAGGKIIPEPNSYVQTTINEDKWTSGKATSAEQTGIEEIKPKLVEVFRFITDLLEKEYPQYILYTDLLTTIYPLAILNEIDSILKDYKTENSILFISEFNKRIADIVLSQPVPFIYERVGEKYRHYLIDEFQDTSVLQWKNLLPLIENALSVNNFTMVVGDGKQAIYRWRSGEVEQFARLPEIYHRTDDPVDVEREKALLRNFNPNVLGKNYRSREEIVQFNNRFFTFLRQFLDEPYRAIYEDVVQQPGRIDTGGFVQMELFDKENSGSFVDFNHNKILDYIADLKERNYNLRDVAILCRSNRNASAIARTLLENGIPVVSAESLLLVNSNKVRLIISFIKWLMNEGDPIAKTEIVYWLSGFEDYLQFQILLKDSGLFDVVKDDLVTATDNFVVFLEKQGIVLEREKLLSLPIYELCEEIIRLFGLDEQADPYLQFFLDAVLELGTDPAMDARDLLTWWENEKKKLSIVVPEGMDAVNIMTIHKAKGLEFPVVIYPFASDLMKKTKDALWVNLEDKFINNLPVAIISSASKMEATKFAPQIVEEAGKSTLDLINLLYVVLTRPVDELYIISQPPPKNSKSVSLPVIFNKFLVHEDLWDETQFIYSFGVKFIMDKEETIEGHDYQFDQWNSKHWNERIGLRYSALKHWDMDYPGEQTKWGTLVHRILADIKTNEDIQRVVQSYHHQGIISAEEKNKLSKEIDEFLSDPVVAGYFKQDLNVKNEPEVLLPDGSQYRPDKLVFTHEKITVIDFKTGTYRKAHEDQVRQYMGIIKKMYTIEVGGVLMYLHDDRRVRVVDQQ